MSKKKAIIIGTRGSKLALAQSKQIGQELSKFFPEVAFELKVIKTKGDKVQDVALAKIEGKGFFTKELEEALLSKEIDLAVHSLKDLPVEEPRGLKIAAITKRIDARDVLIKNKKNLEQGDRIGTSSLRRQSQLRAWKKGFDVADLRGNLDTRIRKLKEGEYQAIVVAMAGLKRLQLTEEVEVLSIDKMMPAPGQGALAIQIRSNDKVTANLVEKLHDPISEIAATAERALLQRLEGGCQVPIGAYSTFRDNILELKAIVASLDGQNQVKGEKKQELTSNDKLREAEIFGRDLAEELLNNGAREILCNIRK